MAVEFEGDRNALSDGEPGVPVARDAGSPRCTVGIMAYNEEANIAHAIRTVLEQRLATGPIAELIVVASGCTDRTAEIVAEIARRDPRVRLILQERREGKASAINLFIAEARTPVLLMLGADILVKPGTIDALLRHFDDHTVGMVGGRPVPVNDERTLLGHAAHLLWRLHDQVARESPKLGEIVAFRNVVPSIPLDTAVDEISIQALITQLRYRLVYEPAAIVYNRGPSTVRDFVRQRRRIYAGHLRIRRRQGYSASTMGMRTIARALRRSRAVTSPRTALWTFCTIALEAAARALAHVDCVRGHQHYVWETVSTTKRHIAEGAGAGEERSVLVFRIVDFQRQLLELGARASRQLTERALSQIVGALGSDAAVSAQQAGTIVAIIAGDRAEAEARARSLVQELEVKALTHGDERDGGPFRLACGMIAFPQAGQPLARPILASVADVGLASTGLGYRGGRWA